MPPLHIDISTLIADCQVRLIDSIPVPIGYADKGALENNKLPASLGTMPINVYALWSRAGATTAWVLMYIGQRSSKFGWSRVEQHLFSTPKRTQSKLCEVRAVIESGAEIGVTAIFVEPDSMRLAIEEELIKRNSQSEADIRWNKKARAPLRKKSS